MLAGAQTPANGAAQRARTARTSASTTVCTTGRDSTLERATAESRRLAARDLADELGIPVGNAVDFWTEAALFSMAGYTSFVYGPGDIAQAHSADEWVALEQLAHYAKVIHRIVDSGR